MPLRCWLGGYLFLSKDKQSFGAVDNGGSVVTLLALAKDLNEGRIQHKGSDITILLTSGQITITNSMGIDASMLPDGITISGNRSSRIFQIESGNTVILDTLTIVDGRAPGGAGVQSDGNLTMRNCTLSRNQSSPLQAGGGLRTFDAQVTLDKCTFDQNRAT